MTMLKKILASGMAVVSVMAASTTAFASDYGKIDYWDLDYSYGAPSSVSKQIHDCDLYFYAGGYQSTCKNFNGGGDGYVSVSVGGTEAWKITGKGTVPQKGYKLNYAGDWVTFRFTAVGERVIASGSVQQYDYQT